MLLAIFGLAVTVIWLAAGAWYAWAVIGLDNLVALMPIELALVIAGLFGPLVLLWLTIAFLHVTQRLRGLEDSIWEINALRMPRIEAAMGAAPPGEGSQPVAPPTEALQTLRRPPPEPSRAEPAQQAPEPSRVEPAQQVPAAESAQMPAAAQAGLAQQYEAAEPRACDVAQAEGPDFDGFRTVAAAPQIEVPPPIETEPHRPVVERRAAEAAPAPAAAAAMASGGPEAEGATSVADRPIGFRHRVRVTAKELNDLAVDLSTALSDEAAHAQAQETYDQGNGDVFFELLCKVFDELEPPAVMRHLNAAGAVHLLGDYAGTFDALMAESKKIDRSGTLGRSVETMPIGRLNTHIRAVLAATPSH